MRNFFKGHRVLGMVSAIVLALSVISISAALALIRSNDVTVNIIDAPQYTLTVNAISGPVYSGTAFTITGSLTSSNGAPIAGKTIKLYTAANTYSGQNAITEAGGLWSGAVFGSATPTSMTVHAEFDPN